MNLLNFYDKYGEELRCPYILGENSSELMVHRLLHKDTAGSMFLFVLQHPLARILGRILACRERIKDRKNK